MQETLHSSWQNHSTKYLQVLKTYRIRLEILNPPVRLTSHCLALHLHLACPACGTRISRFWDDGLLRRRLLQHLRSLRHCCYSRCSVCLAGQRLLWCVDCSSRSQSAVVLMVLGSSIRLHSCSYTIVKLLMLLLSTRERSIEASATCRCSTHLSYQQCYL